MAVVERLADELDRAIRRPRAAPGGGSRRPRASRRRRRRGRGRHRRRNRRVGRRTLVPGERGGSGFRSAPSFRPLSQRTRPRRSSEGIGTPRSATRISLIPSRSRSATSAWAGWARSDASTVAGSSRRPALWISSSPLAMSHARISGRFGSVRWTRATCEIAVASSGCGPAISPRDERPHRSRTVRRPRDDREAIGCRGLVIGDHVLDRRRIELAIGIAVEVEPASDFGIPSSLGKQVGGRISVAIAAKRDDAILEGRLVFGYGLRDGAGGAVSGRADRSRTRGRSPPSAW